MIPGRSAVAGQVTQISDCLCHIRKRKKDTFNSFLVIFRLSRQPRPMLFIIYLIIQYIHYRSDACGVRTFPH